MFGSGWERTEEERKVCKALEEVAKQVGVTSIQAGELILNFRHARTDTCCDDSCYRVRHA